MCKIKVYPVAPITAIFPDDVVIEGNKFKYEVTASDRDNDIFNVALADGYILNLEKDILNKPKKIMYYKL